MATEKEEFKFPDEIETEGKETENKLDIEIEGEEEVKVEVVDDTPEEDRNVEPLPQEVVNELEAADESDDFSKNVKIKFKQYKKAWHDERRVKEAALKEQQEALAVAQSILEENKRLKSMLHSGEKELINNYQVNASLELDKARKAYKEAYDSGDPDKLLEAQQEIVNASLKLDKAKNFRPTVEKPVQEDDFSVQRQHTQQKSARMDDKAAKWVANNSWYVDPGKSKLKNYAISYHNELSNTYGVAFIGTDEYYNKIDQEMRHRFPEEFGVEESKLDESEKPQQKSKPSTVVAPAKRSTSSKKIVLSRTQVALAKKLGLTNEQYANAQLKLES